MRKSAQRPALTSGRWLGRCRQRAKLVLWCLRFPGLTRKNGGSVSTDVKVNIQMRLSNPLLLASLGVLFVSASCTLITDVNRSKIPDGTAEAGAPGTGGSVSNPPVETGGGGASGAVGGAGGDGGTVVPIAGGPSEGGTGNVEPTGGTDAGGAPPGPGGSDAGGVPPVGNAGAGGTP
jgi:hypothetical protein